MEGILELPEARARVKRWTVEEYDRLGELGAFGKDVELIRGIIVRKMSKSPLHRFIALSLYDLLSKLLPGGFFAMHESPLRLGGSEPEPDVSVVRGQKSDFRDRHPSTAALVIEVAVTSVELDRANASLYAEARVEEYWIVMPMECQVEVYRRPLAGAYTQKVVCQPPALLESSSVPGAKVDLGDLFRKA